MRTVEADHAAATMYEVGSIVEWEEYDDTKSKWDLVQARVVRLGMNHATAYTLPSIDGSSKEEEHPLYYNDIDGPYPVTEYFHTKENRAGSLETAEYAERLLGEYNLTKTGWKFRFSLAKRAVGMCCYREKEIHMSLNHLGYMKIFDVKDTLLHEIAHALAVLKVGWEGKGHGPVWRNIAREIGYSGDRLYYGPYIPKWKSLCPCGAAYYRNKLIKQMRYHSLCSNCHQPLNWKPNSTVVHHGSTSWKKINGKEK